MPPLNNQQPNQQPIDEGKRSNLLSMLGEARDARSGFLANREKNTEENGMVREDVLKDVFEYMQQLGIDMSDPEQVKQFLDKLEKENPEIYEAFVSAFEILLAGDGLPEGFGEAIPETQEVTNPKNTFPGLAGMM